MNADIPALDCREVVEDLVDRLGSLSFFLDGIYDLMKFSNLEDYELQRYSRKIIALTEVNMFSSLANSFNNVLGMKGARMTLKREGVVLYLFVLCPEELLPYKSAYFKTLVWIRRRRHAFPADIGDRIASLLFVLESNFVIRCGGVDTRAQLGIEELLVPKNPLAACKSTAQIAAHTTAVPSARTSYATSDVMLPPDAWAKKKHRIHQLAKYVKSEAANTYYPPAPHQYLPSDNWEPPRLRRPFVRTKAQRFEVGTRKQSSLDDLFNLQPFSLD
ncbi:uncharacterized protein BJ212DRAFT_1300586 [Suillus subaureus]|uniref:Uncharacterized protein n=1 Tax=Suillus subaureus TaxID=48587 RepID=A0A9P7JCB8_9AGAM|nr:uncharacterized protein BJ212DRAFT_1300586 [Suillus subaureus]KAG1814264.1 hypothetical protein BJ212DRAFT_1300586 [Suillus subaureus]